MEILLLHIGAATYAVRRDEVEDIRPAPPLFRPPLTPVEMAGVVSLEGRTSVLADLSACLSGRGVSRRDGLTLLLVDTQSDLPGFILEEPPRSIENPAEGIRPLPEVLASEVCRSWMAHGDGPVPLLELTQLQSRLLAHAEYRHQPVGIDFPGSPSDTCDWLVSLNGTLLALSGRAVDVVHAQGRGVPLFSLPDFMPGVLLHEGELVTLCDLALMLTGSSLDDADVVVVDSGAVRIGVPCDVGSHPALIHGKRVPIPRLAARPGLESVVVEDESIYPLIDLPGLCRAGVNWHAIGRESLPVEPPLRVGESVVEVMIHGGRYALPRSVVSGEVESLHIVPLPSSQAIVLGLALCEGDLLPVLDFAPYFGRRSEQTERSRLLLIEQQDFRALLLVESPPQGRLLSPDVQRHLPFQLQESLVCGCYVDERDVVLVLDPLAMAFGFREDVVREFRRQLAVSAGEEVMTSAQSTEWWRLEVDSFGPDRSATEDFLPPLDVAEHVTVNVGGEESAGFGEGSDRDFDAVSGEEIEAEAHRESLSPAGDASAVPPCGPEQAAHDGVGLAAVLEGAAPDLESFVQPDSGAQVTTWGSESGELRGAFGETPRPDGDTADLPVPEIVAGADSTELEPGQTEAGDSVTDVLVYGAGDEVGAGTSMEDERAALPVGRPLTPALHGLDDEPTRCERPALEHPESFEDLSSLEPLLDDASQAGSPTPVVNDATRSADEVWGEGEELLSGDRVCDADLDTLPEETFAPSGDPDEMAISAEETASAGCAEIETGRHAPMSHRPDEIASRAMDPHVRHEAGVSSSLPRRSRIYLLLLLLLVAATGYYFFRDGSFPPGAPPGQVSAQTALLPPAAEAMAVAAEPRIPVEAGDVNAGRVETEQITIVIPAELLKEDLRREDLQVVIRWGDTLWEIADRYTGDPWNYRRIARENGIRNPNLIFPRQRLQIRAE